MAKLLLVPEQSNYSVQRGNENVTTKLDGGASRTRKNIEGAASTVNVEWRCSPNEYDYLMAFYRYETDSGALDFTIDLLLESADLKEYQCKFNDDGPSLSSVRGIEYTVDASLEAGPVQEDEESDMSIIVIYEEFGSNYNEIVNLLAKTANEIAPRALNG